MAVLRKSVLITGCSKGGIGAGLAEVFQGKGYHVFATARTISNIPESLSAASNVTVLPLDVLSSDSIAAAVRSVKNETGGKLDILINNSGGGLFVPALDTSIEDGKKLFDLNFWDPMAVFQAFAPFVIQAKGCVVNNTSANAVVAMAFMSRLPAAFSLVLPLTTLGIYNASKAALATAGKTWRPELKPLGVRVITLITTGVKTHFFAERKLETIRTEITPTSYYYQIRDFIYGLSDGHLQASGISTRQYALKVVTEIEIGTNPIIWAGGAAFWVRWACALSPRFVLVRKVSRGVDIIVLIGLYRTCFVRI